MDNYNGDLNKCFGCGNCCKVIPVGITWERFHELYNQEEDKNSDYAKEIKFILDNWTPIYNFVDMWRIMPDKSINSDNYYTCKQFNKFTHKCNVYAERPRVCKNYPFYGKTEHVNLIYEDCAFNENIKRN